MDPAIANALLQNRRQFFGRSATGIGAAALGSLLAAESQGETSGGALPQLRAAVRWCLSEDGPTDLALPPATESMLTLDRQNS